VRHSTSVGRATRRHHKRQAATTRDRLNRSRGENAHVTHGYWYPMAANGRYPMADEEWYIYGRRLTPRARGKGRGARDVAAGMVCWLEMRVRVSPPRG